MNFNEEVLNHKGLVLVDFYADWCGPCKKQSIVLNDINDIKDIKIVKVDIDENNDIAKQYNIKSIPVLILFKDGVEVNRKIGLTNNNDIKTMINN